MSTKDDALISQMLFGYFGDPNQGTEARQRMGAALSIARREILEEAANHLERRANNLANEFGECPRTVVLREAEQTIRSLNEAKP
jgi:hypothetical protein